MTDQLNQTEQKRTKKLYQELAGRIQAYQNCIKSKNETWQEKHMEAIERLMDMLPSGSGIDSGTIISIEKSTENKLVMYTSYHAMDDNGFYDGWIDITITVKPHLCFDIDLNIKGNFGKYQYIKEYLYDVYSEALTVDVDLDYCL